MRYGSQFPRKDLPPSGVNNGKHARDEMALLAIEETSCACFDTGAQAQQLVKAGDTDVVLCSPRKVPLSLSAVHKNVGSRT